MYGLKNNYKQWLKLTLVHICKRLQDQPKVLTSYKIIRLILQHSYSSQVINFPCWKQQLSYKFYNYIYNTVFYIQSPLSKFLHLIFYNCNQKHLLKNIKNNMIQLNNLLETKASTEYYRMFKNLRHEKSHILQKPSNKLASQIN